ncbi:maker242 [Drosophila busckii]|uniref:Maker242 n=2 Tax=Drosophila busckii TaxID=30019 RepID=A0A0M3QYF2_DROBS|nr:maker242 [Drosophila busckii]
MNALKTQSPVKGQGQTPLNVNIGGMSSFGGLAPSPLTSPNLFGANTQSQSIPQQPAAFANFGVFQQQSQPQPQSSNNNNSSAFDLFQ